MKGEPPSFTQFPHLEPLFDEFMVTGGHVSLTEYESKPEKWRKAMSILCGMRLQGEMRANVGASTWAVWK